MAVSPVLPSGRMQNMDRLTRSGSEKKHLISMFQDWRELQNPASSHGGRTLMKLSSSISASTTAGKPHNAKRGLFHFSKEFPFLLCPLSHKCFFSAPSIYLKQISSPTMKSYCAHFITCLRYPMGQAGP